MPQYMIELAHDADECIESLKSFDPNVPDLLDGVFWGCLSGRHAGWVVISSESQEEALGLIPEVLRNKAIVTQVDVIPEIAEAVIDPEAFHSIDAGPDAK